MFKWGAVFQLPTSMLATGHTLESFIEKRLGDCFYIMRKFDKFKDCITSFFSVFKKSLIVTSPLFYLLFYTELLFIFVSKGHLIYNGNLILIQRGYLLSVNILILQGIYLVGIFTFLLIASVLRKTLFLKKIFNITIFFVSFFTLFFVFFVYWTSWLFFNFSGYFLDLNMLSMLFNNFFLVVKHSLHMRPVGSFAFLIVSPLFILFLIRFLQKRWTDNGLSGRKNYFRFAIFFNVLLLGFLLMGHLYAHSKKNSVFTDDFFYSFESTASPFSTLLTCCLSSTIYRASDDFSNYKVIKKPIISMEEYLKGFDFEKMKKYNVILIIVESLRPDQLKSFSGSRMVMPTIESLAEEAYIFSNTYTQSSHSSYADICPLSSHYPLRSFRMYFYPKKIKYPRVLIYDVLKSLGYKTAIISSQNEHWGNMYNYLDTGNLDKFLHSENYEGETYVPYNDTGFVKWLKGNKRSGKIDDRYTISETIKWIDSLEGEPFCVYLNLQNSHVPYQLPSDFPRKFGPEKIDFKISFNDFPVEKANIVKNIYSDSLFYVDTQIKKLIDHLKLKNMYDNTIFIITGDTGQAFYEHGFAAHANALYNEVMKVPLIIRIPGKHGKRDSRLAQHIDIPPTLFHFLNIPHHPSFQGINLLRKSEDKNRSAYLVAQVLAHQYAVVEDNWKLIFDQRTNEYFLYNLKDDPGELVDVKLKNKELFSTLLRKLHFWKKKQVEYYLNPDLYEAFYPFVFVE